MNTQELPLLYHSLNLLLPELPSNCLLGSRCVPWGSSRIYGTRQFNFYMESVWSLMLSILYVC